MTIEFTNLHGLGNDYLFIDTAKYPIADPPELSRAMSHRHLGAGADGIILIEPGRNGADFSMRIFNADGSEAETCGNGIRCFTCANIGNPHAVFFVDDATKVPLAEIGPKVEHHPAFPKRTNVEFVTVQDRENIVMRIWERGSGITMASGSGSCGSALACMITNRTGRRVNVHLVYGTLTIEWAEDGYVYQEGPATEVYTGTWDVCSNCKI